MTTVIIGVGIVAMVEAQQSFMRSNNWSSQASTAAYLANEIRERMRGLPKHDPRFLLELEESGAQGVLNWGLEDGEVVVDDFNDIDDFDGISFSYVGTPGPMNGDLPGPISASRATIRRSSGLETVGTNIIPEINAAGEVVLESDGSVRPLQGWTQTVTVEKLDPFNTGIVVPKDHETPTHRVHEFPLRVTVIVDYQGPLDPVPQEMARLVWIVP